MDNDLVTTLIVLLVVVGFGTWMALLSMVVPERSKDGKYTSYGAYYPGSKDEQRLKEWAKVMSAKGMRLWLVALVAGWFLLGLAAGWAIWG